MAVVQQRWGEARPSIRENMRDGIWNMLSEQPEFWIRILNDEVEQKETLAKKEKVARTEDK